MPSELWLEREVERLTALNQDLEETLVHERMDRERIIEEEVDRILTDWEKRNPWPAPDPYEDKRNKDLGGWEPENDRQIGVPAIFDRAER